ncbi:acyl-CoA-binding protein [Pseudomonas fluorescens]|uniref:acyl-CoA-binding protein n=1 Tax=Pseudomonas fluorescens TaxID=294 RepID=UPI001907B929|nr:acyl-CoA-binding protein [Pseudomonas fluorescens]MBD8093659.1 acyl-CoA-binding protein [Pseudomonas fluorescens]MBD8717662.1 acyl-CoA-binding protein [Pseudomonas fluorescens]
MSIIDFDSAVEGVKQLLNRPANDELLELYGLYKQSTVGDNDSTRPGFTDFAGKAKWEAWNKLKGTSQLEAQNRYIELANSLINRDRTS